MEFANRRTFDEHFNVAKWRKQIDVLNNKVGFLGLYSACLAVISIYEKYVKAPNSQMKYLLTYKLNQDHLELFFCAIRARSGWYL